ncbi:hypothetical protein D3C78_1619110 [compost metagenome]
MKHVAENIAQTTMGYVRPRNMANTKVTGDIEAGRAMHDDCRLPARPPQWLDRYFRVSPELGWLRLTLSEAHTPIGNVIAVIAPPDSDSAAQTAQGPHWAGLVALLERNARIS